MRPLPILLALCLAASLTMACRNAAFAQSNWTLTQPIGGQARRASSADPAWDHGNTDFRLIPAGGKLVFADLSGPGVIEHIWITVGRASGALPEGWPRKLELRFFWDDDDSTPSVQAPLGDFFACGNGKTAPQESAMVQVGGQDVRAFNAYWAMPFSRHARLEIHSTLDVPIEKFYFHVDWLALDQLQPATCRFHARYREAYPLAPGSDYVIAEISGRGHYVGTVFSLVNTPGSGFGEGDERFFIDGEERPLILGTGSEDYFCMAWGFKDHKSLYHGYTTLSDGATMYRWHVPDPIPFRQSLRMTLENWGNNGQGHFGELTWNFSSVAFWYEQPPGTATSSRALDWRKLN